MLLKLFLYFFAGLLLTFVASLDAIATTQLRKYPASFLTLVSYVINGFAVKYFTQDSSGYILVWGFGAAVGTYLAILFSERVRVLNRQGLFDKDTTRL